MSAPPAIALAPSCSSRRYTANTAAQMGSVQRSTVASDELIFPREVVSPSRLSAVVTRPVHATAARAAGETPSGRKPPMSSPSGPSSNETAPALAAAAPWGEGARTLSRLPPSRTNHASEASAATVTCTAVMGRVWSGFLAIIFSVRQNAVPKPTHCSSAQASPQEGETPPSGPISSRKTPTIARAAAIHVLVPTGFLSTTNSSNGHHTTASAQMKPTVAAGSVSKAMACPM
mmetsp:Transcript_127598/g.346285  ORF Transcript_127598/g.346285 Transcript_127598/m.346285 type:complete len:232 (+) Transcript_127598:444-1139(+)